MTGALQPLSADQRECFAALGFVRLKAALAGEEVAEVQQEADRLWHEDFRRDPSPTEQIMQGGFVERSARLFELVDHPRIYGAVHSLLGDDVVFYGSEGNRGVAGLPVAHHWHADRRGAHELGLVRIKVMIYLSPMTEANGALRVIPGSHRAPLHLDLLAFNDRQTVDEPRYFGMRGNELPAHIIETTPGDVLLFNQNLYHAVYFTEEPARRYIALKYSEWPESEEQRALLGDRAAEVFSPAERALACERPLVQRMVHPILEAGAPD